MQKILVNLIRISLIEFGIAPPELQLTQVCETLLQKINAMPIVLKVPILILTWVFNCSGIFVNGRLFQSQNSIEQAKTYGFWQNASVKIMRELILFYKKMSVFIYYSI